ncbi:RAB6-interacting golgin isoform X2 [Trichosurus vulpecula]|uniref:RAB6-interacting golgin isoform X2 n=1 Tax=Trichosurus vulpecula TaxID=9337 RepID=UPI00186B4C60|nr:RAB6-interacting golgin isoform X2 [Trichosurus vulpecula]
MAQGWAGFSEEELRRLRQNKDPFEPVDRQRRHPVNKSRQQLQREKALQQQSQKLGLQDGTAAVPPEQLLSAPKRRADSQQHHTSPTLLISPGDNERHQNMGNQQKKAGLENSCNNDVKKDEMVTAKPNCKLEKKKVELQEKSHWEVLQEEQRLMEEKNKRKKALLAKAIAERSKRTQAETMKLQRIQKELQALDDMVSADIGILRNRIDQASLDYSYARKRFDKAEAEYVAAKLDLQRKTEIKEHLTEHLCTIIQQNELRKARKLEALMQQLEVEADEESLELEIEVEKLLQQQEEEGRRQTALSEEAPKPSGSGVTLDTAAEGSKGPDAAVVPQVEGQDTKAETRACPDPGRPEQDGETAADTLPAHQAT